MDMMPILAMVGALADGVGDFIGELLAAVAASTAWLVRAVYKNRRRIDALEAETEINEDPTRFERDEERLEHNEDVIEDIKQYFEGDPNDPDNDGLLYEMHEIREAVQDDD